MSHERALPSGLRSYLFAPGNHPRKVAKVFAAGADAVLLDLEDAVPIAEKESTRAAVVEAMRAPRAVRGYIRVNGLETAWCADDIACVVGHGVDGIVLPKIESAEQVRAAAAFIAAAERVAGLAVGAIELMAIVETARGIEFANEIAAADPRLKRLAFGGGDYTNEIFPKLRAGGWSGHWIDAASALRMKEDAVLILDPVNRPVIDKALAAGGKNWIGSNCTVSLMMMAMGGLWACTASSASIRIRWPPAMRRSRRLRNKSRRRVRWSRRSSRPRRQGPHRYR
ncbi:MAG: hypothetical protein EBR51_11275 [Gammaproteobacteria bacterium]|nr:hypothetical protein [Gammaproteobacteria bacterium]